MKTSDGRKPQVGVDRDAATLVNHRLGLLTPPRTTQQGRTVPGYVEQNFLEAQHPRITAILSIKSYEAHGEQSADKQAMMVLQPLHLRTTKVYVPSTTLLHSVAVTETGSHMTAKSAL
jgi:hypothetical protein